MANPRAGKVAERIQQIIARRLEKGLRDPRLGFVTITDVRVTGDLQHASIFYTVYGSEDEQKDSAAALKAATGMLRSEVGRQLGTRLTPTLEFIHDELPETAEHLSVLLAEAKQRDEAAQALAANAQYAGEADPYSKPQAEEADDSDDEDDELEALDEEVDDDFDDEDLDDTDEDLDDEPEAAPASR
ncbi:ribosome-binding factor A [Leucobacter sp. OLJS4]|uniref:30S ribosome-binding factor RbfA n=1 Tax=unclassified Leucobacter TaxID=2621730 RepID=UPI000C199C45|nr:MULTISPECIES: 30S ribosome-binding factor RbfA [unclassified Leucobacter]PIJ48119.1 ribosome-binding factor A [Leucobacter sp. OLES1]PII84500.1 ribosome-binding factor A [Leucobacter sp. OLCALW19]PII88737.1 ribosome-binding factor A [Leucobacter sp. OLTLW20]PII90905.1 ribosome-binding factor A [Leucobacter sp. OLAS13]PII97652.1 ribosome-binding factor A [Leucobacter sp. OLDS2]